MCLVATKALCPHQRYHGRIRRLNTWLVLHHSTQVCSFFKRPDQYLRSSLWHWRLFSLWQAHRRLQERPGEGSVPRHRVCHSVMLRHMPGETDDDGPASDERSPRRRGRRGRCGGTDPTESGQETPGPGPGSWGRAGAAYLRRRARGGEERRRRRLGWIASRPRLLPGAGPAAPAGGRGQRTRVTAGDSMVQRELPHSPCPPVPATASSCWGCAAAAAAASVSPQGSSLPAPPLSPSPSSPTFTPWLSSFTGIGFKWRHRFIFTPMTSSQQLEVYWPAKLFSLARSPPCACLLCPFVCDRLGPSGNQRLFLKKNKTN